jgi:hypothetical protein
MGHQYCSRKDKCGRQVFYERCQSGETMETNVFIPWLDEVSEREQNSKNDANAADDNICNSQEGVLAAHDCRGRE